MRRTLCLLFFLHLLTRLLFINLEGINNNYNLQCDSYWLVPMADQAVLGDFSFDNGRFITSPLFPVVCGLFKIIFHTQWSLYFSLFQILLAAVSGLYIYRIALLIFDNKSIALLSSLLYAFFPMTLYYVHTFSQESLFQSFLIITIYYLLASLRSDKMINTIKAAVFFSLTYLTKSHILIFSLFIPLIYFHTLRMNKKTFKHVAVFSVIAFLFSLPYGIYQYKSKDSYVISSNGAGYQFYLGNTEVAYVSIVDVPEQASMEYSYMKDITVSAGYYNGSEARYKSLLDDPQRIKQKEFFSDAIVWLRTHPLKTAVLKLYDAALFITPGVSFRHYSLLEWLETFLICAPVYLLSYIWMYRLCRKSFSKHSWIFYLFLSMFIFSTVWYVQNRFRTITLEPFYIIYASYGFYQLLGKSVFGKKAINFLDFLFLRFLQSIEIRKMIFGK